MNGLLSLLGKHLRESRWLLILSSLALFGLSWLSVYRTANIEERFADPDRRSMRIQAFLTAFGGPSMDMSSIAIETLHLYLLFMGIPVLIFLIWGISRGSLSVAGDLERGTMDLVLSRPVTRITYLVSQVLAVLLGYLVMILAIVAGNLISGQFNAVQEPASVLGLIRPALNLAMVGMAAFGYTLFLSSIDIVRWRPNLFGSVITLAQFVAFAVANQPDWDEWEWLNHASIFSAFYPIDSAVKGESLAYNLGVLGGVAVAGMVLGLLIFQRRDLPASGG